MDLKQTYNLIAKGWYEKHSDDDWWVEGTDKFISCLKPGATVLDVGCGAGVKSRYLASKGIKVTGTDFAEEMIRIAQKDVPEAEFKVWDLRATDQLPGKFDGTLAQAVLLHFPKKEIPKILKKLSKKIKKGGYLYIAVKEKRPDGPGEANIKQDQYGTVYERFFSFFTMEELENFTIKAGFKSCYKQKVANDTWKNNWLILIVKKP